MFAFWSLTLLALFGCTWLHDVLAGYKSLSATLGGLRIPIVGIDVTGAFLIALGLFLVLVVIIHRTLDKPKYADVLIDTEAELKKVTWPTWEDVINSSIVVVVSVVILGFFLAGADWLLHRVMQVLILGGTA